jgi:hypothetical protein
MNPTQYPPPIRLTELVEAAGVDGVRVLAAQIGALEIAAKANQVWRYVLDGAIIIGYANSAVVAGRDELTMRRAVALLRLASGSADAALREEARALDLAVTARSLATARRDDDYFGHVQNLVAHCADLDAAEAGALLHLLDAHAPAAGAWLALLIAVYQQGYANGYDVALASPVSEDDLWLPEIPAEPVALSA